MLYPLGFTNIAGWNIIIFNRKDMDSIRGPHFPATAMLDDPGGVKLAELFRSKTWK